MRFLLLAIALIIAGSLPAQTVELTAEGSGYYRVYVDDTEVSKHVAEREAIESATNRAAENPDSVVEYKHDYRVSVVVDVPAPEPDEPVDPTDPDPTDPTGPADPVDPVDSTEANAHFESLRKSPNLVKAWTLRDVDQWDSPRNQNPPHTSRIEIDQSIDAAKFILPPLANEGGGWMFEWGEYPWEVGDKLVVQHDFMLSESLFDSDVGEKFTNLCRNGSITFELRPGYQRYNPCPFDLRAYTAKLEGRQERDQLASDVGDPTKTYFGRGGGYDKNPGPDSTWPYSGNLFVPAGAFVANPGEWVRVTYELERTAEGSRIKVWLASESREPALIIASPIDPTKGFATGASGAVNGWYAELDTSQEKYYDEPQAERWVAFRNLLVLSGVDGKSVLGGKPSR